MAAGCSQKVAAATDEPLLMIRGVIMRVFSNMGKCKPYLIK
jgi:hypothetical protein